MTVSFDALKESVAGNLGIPSSSIKFLRYSQNAVYEVTLPNASTSCILRITSASHRSDTEILGELEWMRFLQEQNLPVCSAITFPSGEYLHTSKVKKEWFHAVLFRKAPGQTPTIDQLSPRLYHAHGALLGRLHASNRRAPINILCNRKTWHQERYFTTDIDTCIPLNTRPPLHRVLEADLSIINSWPMSSESHGPIHADLGYSNFHLHEGALTVFDFDNCTLGPLAMDIAAALYGAIFTGIRRQTAGDQSVFEHPQTSLHLEAVWHLFKEGYQSVHSWSEEWDAHISICFRVLYFRAVLHAARLLKFNENPEQHPALQVDINNLINREMPLQFDFDTGKALA